MNSVLWIILPWVTILGFFLYIFSQKRESERMRSNAKNMDWITFLSVIIGVNIIVSAMRSQDVDLPDSPWLMIALVLFIGVLLVIAIIRKAMTGRPLAKIIGDERLEVIYAKSSRNAFFTTYLALFVHLLVTDSDSLQTSWLLIVVTSGIFVLIASLLVYYFRKS